MWQYPRLVIFKEKVYIGGGVASSDGDQTVIVYDPKQDSYDTLPPYTCKYFVMAVVNNQLVLVSGMDVQTGKVINKLGVWNEKSKRWTHPLPPMTTACNSSSVATHNNRWLVVMGGYGAKLVSQESRSWTLMQHNGTMLHHYLSHFLNHYQLSLVTCVISSVATLTEVHHPRKCSVCVWMTSSLKLFPNQLVQVLHPHHHHGSHYLIHHWNTPLPWPSMEPLC